MNLNGELFTSSTILEKFEDVTFSENIKFFPLICVYANPLDMPEFFVARLFDGGFATKWICIAETLEDLEYKIPKFMKFIDRSSLDEKHIIGTWI